MKYFSKEFVDLTNDIEEANAGYVGQIGRQEHVVNYLIARGWSKSSETAECLIRKTAEFNQLMEDFKSVVYHTKTKSANMCNFCKKDCGESGQVCRGKEDWIHCSFEWRGIVETQADGE